MEDSGLVARAGFNRDVTVEFFAEGGVELANFSYVLETRPRSVFKVVHFKGGQKSYVRQISDAIHSFDRAVANGFVSGARCVVLTDSVPKGKDAYLDKLRSVATIVDVTAPGAAQSIRELTS